LWDRVAGGLFENFGKHVFDISWFFKFFYFICTVLLHSFLLILSSFLVFFSFFIFVLAGLLAFIRQVGLNRLGK